MKLLIHSQTLTVQPLKLGMDKQFHPTRYYGYNYLSKLGLKLNHVSKRGPMREGAMSRRDAIVCRTVGRNWSNYRPII